MNLQQLSAYIENKQGVLSCVNYDALAQAIDFKAIKENEQKASQDFGIKYYSSPALRIEGETAIIKVRGLLAPDIGVDLVEFGLTGYDVIEHYLNYANSLPHITNIVLDIDSGGGFVQGVQRCAEKIKGSTKNISTFVSGDMYSAAYWLGCSTNRLTATPYSGIGSIGAYVEHFDRSANLEKQGIVARIFRSGKWKGAFGADLPLTQEEQARLQQDIDLIADEFFTHVAKQRGLSKATLAGFEGDTFTAEKALELGLIDQIENVNQTDGGEKMGSNVTADHGQTITSADIEQIKAQAREEAKAEFQAMAEREKAIAALETTEEVKQVLASEAFSRVEIQAMTELVKAIPKGFSQAMNEIGGAGVEADPAGFAPQSVEQKKLAEQAESLKKLAQLKNKGL